MMRFFLPLAATVVFISATHSIIDAGLARFPNPKETLAGYAVARSLAGVLNSPMFMMRQTTVSLVRDKRSYQVVRRGLFLISLLLFFLIAAVGYTEKLSQLLLGNIMGLHGAAYSEAVGAIRLMAFLPVASGWRNFFHGIAILKGGNNLLPLATGVRMAFLLVFLFVIAPGTAWQGSVVGSIAFVGGMTVEALTMAIALRFAAGRSPGALLPIRHHGVHHGLSWPELSAFFTPLALTALIMTGTGPLVNAFLARGTQPEIALAAFAVAFALGEALSSPTNMLHQCCIRFLDESDPRSERQVRRFIAGTGVFFAALLATVAYTPIGPWLMQGPIGLSRPIAEPAIESLKVFFVIPLAGAGREYVWGLLMRRRQTRLIGGAKGLTILVLALILVAGLQLFPGDMAVVAVAAIAVAGAAEVALLARRYRPMTQTPTTGTGGDPRPV